MSVPRPSLGPDYYLARALRYVPLEALAAYLALENFLGLPRSATPTDSLTKALVGTTALPNLIFLVFVFLVPIYTWQGPSRIRSFLAMLSFVVWSVAMGTSVFLPPSGILSGLYSSTAAGLLFIAFAVGANFFNAELTHNERSPVSQAIPVDGYLVRTRKYMPAEALGGYLAAQNLLGFKSAAADQAASIFPVHYLSFAALVLCMLSIPFVLWIGGRRSGSSWATQAAVSTAGFMVWVYAIGGRLFLPGSGDLDEWHHGPLAATLLLSFTFGSGLIGTAAPRGEQSRWTVHSAYATAIVLAAAGILLPQVAPQSIRAIGLNVLTTTAIPFIPLLGVATVFHHQALVAVLKPALPTCFAVFAVVYGLARLALFDLAVGPSPTITPGDGRIENGRTIALWIDRDGSARLDRDGDTATIDRHGTAVHQAFGLSGGAAALTVDWNGKARIVDIHGAGRRGSLDMPRLTEIARDRLWDPYVAPLARFALFLAAQVLPLEIPQSVRGRRGRAFRDCEMCPEMIEIDPGYFLIGSPLMEVGRHSNESPRRLVTIEQAFAVGRFAVTFDEWNACVADGGCNGYKPDKNGSGRQPVMDVSWENAKSYIDWLSKKTGKSFRLLTEAEREYVARAGTTTSHWWGNMMLADKANFANHPVTVDVFSPNPWGVYLVYSNIFWEWVEDCYHSSYAEMPTDGRSWEAGCDDGKDRVLRGGPHIGAPYDDAPQAPRSATRNWRPPDSHSTILGFRVARSL